MVTKARSEGRGRDAIRSLRKEWERDPSATTHIYDFNVETARASVTDTDESGKGGKAVCWESSPDAWKKEGVFVEGIHHTWFLLDIKDNAPKRIEQKKGLPWGGGAWEASLRSSTELVERARTPDLRGQFLPVQGYCSSKPATRTRQSSTRRISQQHGKTAMEEQRERRRQRRKLNSKMVEPTRKGVRGKQREGGMPSERKSRLWAMNVAGLKGTTAKSAGCLTQVRRRFFLRASERRNLQED